MSPMMIESLAAARLAEQRETVARIRLRRQLRTAKRPVLAASAPPNLLIVPRVRPSLSSRSSYY